MLNKIPLQRLLYYVLLIGFLPSIFSFFSFYLKKGELQELRSLMGNAALTVAMKEKKQALNSMVRKYYRDADHFYIDRNLETLNFLESEIENLQQIASDINFSNNTQIQKRLDFLQNNNTLVFSEGMVQPYPFFQETVETLLHPIEVDVNDLKKILAKIEGLNISEFKPNSKPPQLIITDFKIEKKKSNEKNDILSLNMKLLKREFH